MTRRLIWLVGAGLAAQSSDYERGLALFEKGDAAGAIPLLAHAAQEQPRDAVRWKALGVAHAAIGEYQQAEGPFHRACELDAKLREACYFYARVLYALDRYDASLEVLQKIGPESWQVRLGMAQALEALGRAAEAEKQYRQALAMVQRRDAQAGAAFGQFLVRQGRMEEAAGLLTEQVKLFPDSGETRIQLGRALLETGHAAEALPHLEKAVALAARSAQAHLLLAKCYVREGRAAEAQQHFDAAARLEPATAK